MASINASGHKYGLVYRGVGWVLWGDAKELPEELISKVNHLGGGMPTFALNFSRPGAAVVARYYTFIRLDVAGSPRCSSRRGTSPCTWRPIIAKMDARPGVPE